MLVIMDMEWIENAEKEACPTQLSAMRVDASWDCVSRFDELIKPQDQSCQQWSHMAYAGYPSSAFLEAGTITEVIEKFDAWLLKDDVLCWWGDQPALVLNTVVRKNYGRSVHHPMRTIFPAFSRTVKDGQSTEGSPYKLARLRGIATPRIEHCSRNDVDVIQTLLKSVRMRTKPVLQSNVDMEAAIKPSDQYKKPKQQKSAALTEYFYDPKENKLHRSVCEKAKRSQEIIGIVSIKEAIKRNYPPCSCCREEYWNYSWQQAQEAIRKCGYCFVYTWQSKYFHKPTCIHAKRIPYVQLRGSVYYESCIQGKKLPCGWCKPSEKDEVEPEHLYIPNGGQGIKKPKKNKAEMQYSPWATTRRLDKAEKTAYRRYEQAKKERELGSGNPDMTKQERKDFLVLTQPGNAYWAATGYKFFHIRNCPTLDKLSHLRGFSKYNDAVRAGYSPCKECKPTPKYDIKASIPIFSEERENESIEQLDQLCESWHFTHSCEGQIYHIETPVGKWKLDTASRPVDVYHINLVKTPGNGHQEHTYNLIYMEEFLEKGYDASDYAYEFTEQAVILGFLVAETPLTQRYIYELIADVLSEASFFGFEQEYLQEEKEKLLEAEREIDKGNCEGTTLEEFEAELEQEQGFTFDRESDDERALSHEVLVAELAYNSHSRKKELDLIRSMIV